MLLGLKRRIISRFLQSAKSKLTEKQNVQEIQRCLEDGISFCRVTDKTPCKGKVLKFNCVNYPTQYDFFQRVTSNNKVSKSSNIIFLHEAPNVLTEAVLTDIHEHAENYGKNQAMEYNKYYNGYSLVDIPKNENVVVKLRNEYMHESFNAAHLRRIIYGRFITNITKVFNKNVTFINYLEDWMLGQSRNVWVGEHEKMYQRLGIKFDVTCAQSHYTEQTNKIISKAKEKNLLEIYPETGYQCIKATAWHGEHDFEILESDYTSYWPRDFAAFVDDFNKYHPDRLICLSFWSMEQTEREYPGNFKRTMKELESDQPGRIEFTRLKVVVPFSVKYPSASDELDELMISKTAIMLKHKLGEDCESLSDVSDKLRISQFAMQNFKRMKCENYLALFYSKEMKRAFNGRDGATLQYTHARLCRLITLCSDDYSFESVDFNLLSEDCAIRLVQHLARYHEVLIQCYMELETHHLVNYLITFLKLEHIAYEKLLVFNQPKNIRDARLTLFKCTWQVLANGMNILGIQPLGKI